MQFGTPLQVDAGHFARSRDAPDGTEIRRARLSFSGNTGPWEFRLEGELAGAATLSAGQSCRRTARRRLRPGELDHHQARSCMTDKGIFDGIRPREAVAWELATRLSQLDLSDAGIDGGRESNAALALNAYVSPWRS